MLLGTNFYKGFSYFSQNKQSNSTMNLKYDNDKLSYGYWVLSIDFNKRVYLQKILTILILTSLNSRSYFCNVSRKFIRQ